MADDAQITEEEHFSNEKRIHPFFYACRNGTKVKSLPRFCEFF